MRVGVRSRRCPEPPATRKKGLTMKRFFKRRRRTRRWKVLGPKNASDSKGNGADVHKWANKMEIHRLTSGKADLEIKR